MMIGLVGLMGSGKSSVARILEETYRCKSVSFAGVLKDIVAVLFGWDRSLVEGDTVESREWRETPSEWWSRALGREITPRKALQEIGTNLFRERFHDEIWVLSALRQCPLHQDCVFTDTRFLNEAATIKRAGGFIVRVKRGDDPEWFRIAQNAGDDDEARNRYPDVHLSEWESAKIEYDAVIENDGTLEDLSEKVKYLYEELKEE